MGGQTINHTSASHTRRTVIALLAGFVFVVLAFFGALVSLQSNRAVALAERTMGEHQDEATDESFVQEVDPVEDDPSDNEMQQSAERKAAIAELPELPAGAKYAYEEVIEGEDEQTIYESGYFASNVALDWQCSWLSEAVRLAENGNLEGANAAIDQLLLFTETSMSENFPDFEKKVNHLGVPIRTGDTVAAKNYLAGNCSPETLVH